LIGFCSSVLTHAEVLPWRHFPDDASKESLYWSHFNGVITIDYEVDRQVMAFAREIRGFYYEEGDPRLTPTGYKMLGLGDSIHLATAIIIGATEFHTRDKRPSGGNIGLLDLLSLTTTGKVADRRNLKIVSPEDDQTDLLDSLPRRNPQ
jgi:hypothetical protein